MATAFLLRTRQDVDQVRSGIVLVAGVDEAGRGPLAGPVVAAAVILHSEPNRAVRGLKDSKLLSAQRRDALAIEIKAKALAWAVEEADVQEIDTHNILQATMRAMSRAVQRLNIAADLVLIDGNRCPPLTQKSYAVIKGDMLVDCISAASILAKTHRDALMCTLALQYPQYGFEIHKGYPTLAHLQNLSQHGPCPQHRQSFAPVKAASFAHAS
jgi:ribonuclease HII